MRRALRHRCPHVLHRRDPSSAHRAPEGPGGERRGRRGDRRRPAYRGGWRGHLPRAAGLPAPADPRGRRGRAAPGDLGGRRGRRRRHRRPGPPGAPGPRPPPRASVDRVPAPPAAVTPGRPPTSQLQTGRNTMKIVVIGGTGRVGSTVVSLLLADGHDAVPASPDTGVNTITGEGLADVMVGADAVVDVSNAPVWDDEAVREFFTTSTRNLLAAERDAGVQHHVALTIVGGDRLPDSGYLRAKVAQEAEIEAGAIPYTILRATQFFEFLPQIAEEGAEGDTVRLSTGLMQLVAVDDVAAALAELATGAPAGRVEIGGPEALGVDAWARRLFAATGDERTVVTDPHALYFGTELHGGELTTGPDARIGKIDFDTWFASQYRS